MTAQQSLARKSYMRAQKKTDVAIRSWIA